MKNKKILLIALFTVLLSSCSDDFLSTDFRSDFSGQKLEDLAKSNPEAVLIIASGIEGGNQFFLNDFSTAGHGNIHDEFGLMSHNLGFDLMGNDMVQTLSHWFSNYYNYTGRNEASIRTDALWQFYYKVIYSMNEGLKLVPSDVTVPQLQHIRGRLLAMRGFAYFQLARIYTNYDGISVPISTEEGALAARQPIEDVKARILADWEEAYTLLDGYTRTNKTMVDKKVVAGFLARFNLEYGNYSEAATYAVAARSGYSPMGTADLLDGFNKISNAEWMWGADIDTNTSTYYASFFSNIGNLNNGYAGQLQSYKSVDRRIFDAINPNDTRKEWFLDTANPYGLPKYANAKFVDDTDFEGDYVFMRAAEMYLIEAEAKALAGDDQGARQALFNLISTRISGYTLSTNSGQALLNEIRFNRKVELWGEGFSYFDMKRWNIGLDRTYSGSNHASFGFFNYPAGSVKLNFQIPLGEVNTNPELGAQNPF
jgi:hypothetical protein